MAKEKELDELELEPDGREIKEDGPMTRARTKRLREMVAALVKKFDLKEEKKEEAQSVLVCLSTLEEFWADQWPNHFNRLVHNLVNPLTQITHPAVDPLAQITYPVVDPLA
ncbi:hypothetical protein Bca4012_020485 [Brassica carinata]